MDYTTEDIIKKLSVLENTLLDDRNHMWQAFTEIKNNRELIANLKDRLTTITNQQEVIKNTVFEIEKIERNIVNTEIKERIARIEGLIESAIKQDLALRDLIEEKTKLFENLHKHKKVIQSQNKVIRVILLIMVYFMFAVDGSISIKDDSKMGFYLKNKEVPLYINLGFGAAVLVLVLDKEQIESIVSSVKNIKS